MSSVEARLFDALRTADRGVVVLAVAGLSTWVAEQNWASASIEAIRCVSATEAFTVLEQHSGTVLARELDSEDIPGTRIPSPSEHKLMAQAEDPPLLVANVVADLDKAMPDTKLLWTYLNVTGDDELVAEAMIRLDAHAARWTAAGWTVLAYGPPELFATW